MVYTPHIKVKPEKMANAAVQVLEQQLTLPGIFRREGFEAYKGAKGDVVNMRVEGVLPFHRYAFRNDRSEPIVTDQYTERTVAVGLVDHFYNATELTDEQKDFDLLDWGFLLGKQTKAVSRGLQRAAQEVIESNEYEVVIGGANADLVESIAEARRVLNRFQVPDGSRWLVVGSDFEMALQSDERVALAQNSGDQIASDALKRAYVGELKGFQVILDNTIEPSSAYAFVDGGYVWAAAAPSVPRSVGYGATASYEGLTMRVMQDYVADYMYDRQIVDIWSGMRSVKDVLVGWEASGDGLGQEKVSEKEYFVRGVKITLDGESKYPETGSELATITGVDAATGFENGARGDVNA